MKKLIYTLLFVLISVAANGQQAKYVFYFIGDGMGVNQVNVQRCIRQNCKTGAPALNLYCSPNFR